MHTGFNRCVVMQPTYLPWLGYFDLMDQSDVFVFLDNVQFSRQSWMCRNRIKTAQGEQLLVLPMSRQGHHQDVMLNEALIVENKWRKKHLRSIEHAYRKSPFFESVFPVVESLLLYKEPVLSKFNIYIIQQICRQIGLTHPHFRIASDMANANGSKDERLVGICQEMDCKAYLSTPGSSDYLEAEAPGGLLVKHGISLYYHHYEHPTYPQLYGEFVPHMCILDLLFNVGFEDALPVIRSGRCLAWDYREFRKEVLGMV